MGAWHIDHIIPKSSFSFQNNTDQGFKKCWALSNLQPLWAIDNIRKGSKILEDVDVGLQDGVIPWGDNVECGVDIDIERDNKESVEYKISLYLFKKIQQNNPGCKEPNLKTWSGFIDKMIRIDKRIPREIRDVIEWCQADSFWHKQILSTSKLRDKYDQLVVNMGNKKQPTPTKIAGAEAYKDYKPEIIDSKMPKGYKDSEQYKRIKKL